MKLVMELQDLICIENALNMPLLYGMCWTYLCVLNISLLCDLGWIHLYCHVRHCHVFIYFLASLLWIGICWIDFPVYVNLSL